MSCRGAEKRVVWSKGTASGRRLLTDFGCPAAGADLEFVPLELGYGRWERTGKRDRR